MIASSFLDKEITASLLNPRPASSTPETECIMDCKSAPEHLCDDLEGFRYDFNILDISSDSFDGTAAISYTSSNLLDVSLSITEQRFMISEALPLMQVT